MCSPARFLSLFPVPLSPPPPARVISEKGRTSWPFLLFFEANLLFPNNPSAQAEGQRPPFPFPFQSRPVVIFFFVCLPMTRSLFSLGAAPAHASKHSSAVRLVVVTGTLRTSGLPLLTLGTRDFLFPKHRAKSSFILADRPRGFFPPLLCEASFLRSTSTVSMRSERHTRRLPFASLLLSAVFSFLSVLSLREAGIRCSLLTWRDNRF